MITVGIPVTTRFDLFRKAVLSLLRSDVRPECLIVLDQRDGCPPDLYQELAYTLKEAGIRLIWLVPERQVSLAAAWNNIIREAETGLIAVANDDVQFEPDTLGSLIRAAEAHPDELVFVSPQDPVNRWSLFLARRRLLDVVGWFDEAFYPLYYEDNDLEYRLKLAGHHVIDAPGCTYVHEHSATLKAKTAEETALHWQQFKVLETRYLVKWGGLPGQEKYTEPFNGLNEDAAFKLMDSRRSEAIAR